MPAKRSVGVRAFASIALLTSLVAMPLCARAEPDGREALSGGAGGRHPEVGRQHPGDRWREGHGHRRDGADPLVPMLTRIDRYLQRHEDAGVVLDARVAVNATEAIRLSVVSQLLAYTELYKVVPGPRLRRDITDRADFLIARFDAVVSGSVFDGMFGYALLEAYAATGESRYLDYGRRVAAELLALPSSERILNGGLMGAMALARLDAIETNADARRFVDDVMASLPAYQHANGSFPHWCFCSTDIHYTDWMATELILIRRVDPRPDIPPMLGRMRAFLESRVDDDGVTRYEDSCAAYPGCVIPYYSIATGCAIDYDTRAWTNELGYSALAFDDAGSPAYGRVMGFLRSLEHGGTFPDKWDFWGPESDPYYVWTAADTSVINTSLIFWSLASVLSGRGGRAPCHELASGTADGEPAILTRTRDAAPQAAVGEARPRGRAGRGAVVDSLLAAGDSPRRYCDETATPAEPSDGAPIAIGGGARPFARDANAVAGAVHVEVLGGGHPGAGLSIRVTLPGVGPSSLEVLDAGGRRVRDLGGTRLAPGASRVAWDLSDGGGRPCASGMYFIVLRQGEVRAVARAVVLR